MITDKSLRYPVSTDAICSQPPLLCSPPPPRNSGLVQLIGLLHAGHGHVNRKHSKQRTISSKTAKCSPHSPLLLLLSLKLHHLNAATEMTNQSSTCRLCVMEILESCPLHPASIYPLSTLSEHKPDQLRTITHAKGQVMRSLESSLLANWFYANACMRIVFPFTWFRDFRCNRKTASYISITRLKGKSIEADLFSILPDQIDQKWWSYVTTAQSLSAVWLKQRVCWNESEQLKWWSDVYVESPMWYLAKHKQNTNMRANRSIFWQLWIVIATVTADQLWLCNQYA